MKPPQIIWKALWADEVLQLNETEEIDAVVVMQGVEDPELPELQGKFVTLMLNPNAGAADVIWEVDPAIPACRTGSVNTESQYHQSTCLQMIAFVRDLRGTAERERAAMGILVVATEPTKSMKQEAVAAGSYRSLVGNFPKIQIVTAAQLLEGTAVEIPSLVKIQTTKKNIASAGYRNPRF